MEVQYEQAVSQLKALSDANRLMILDMLSCGELCACEILEKMKITQPTLSHHMKILCACGLVLCRKEGKNMFYRLNEQETSRLEGFVHQLFSTSLNCICN
ncbi:ArsR/SmtB family transcription factor [Listeria kieliensis]|uniref:ArsR family transcriptional regulator n=1 Tax=Listeria kieliensis TaxID=1621700 RepID=A0A3D8TK06_9LIST|nr:metalloregulator ArsR/SmtB family transcription factor [Listeria kieliensis]RDW99124.1 ArsR family transcriptional regulator [Listeria kieliensis]